MDDVTTMLVTVPQGATGGQPMNVDLPGRGVVKILVPAGLGPGDSFSFKVANAALNGGRARAPVQTASVNMITVTVPPGAVPGSSIPMQLPNGRLVLVVIPLGVTPGTEIVVPHDPDYGFDSQALPEVIQNNVVNQDIARVLLESAEEARETPAQLAEREAFLAALPEDVRLEILAQETAQKNHLAAFGR